MHIHAADGTILFDIDDAIPQPDGTYIWVFTPVGPYYRGRHYRHA